MYVERDEEGWGCYPNNERCQDLQEQRQHDSDREEETDDFHLKGGQPLDFS